MKQVHVRLTATSTDLLAGTILATAGPGLWILEIAADTDAATVTFTTVGERQAQADPIAMTDADATLDIRKIRAYEILVPDGQNQPTIQVGGTVTEVGARITYPNG